MATTSATFPCISWSRKKPSAHSAVGCPSERNGRFSPMHNIFYIIGVIVVVLLILSFFGLR